MITGAVESFVPFNQRIICSSSCPLRQRMLYETTLISWDGVRGWTLGGTPDSSNFSTSRDACCASAKKKFAKPMMTKIVNPYKRVMDFIAGMNFNLKSPIAVHHAQQ